MKKYRALLEVKLADTNDQINVYEQASISYQQFSDVINHIADKLQNADDDLMRLVLEALNIRATLRRDGTITIAGVIPTRVREVVETTEV